MATLIPPPAKRVRREGEIRSREQQDAAPLASEEESVRLLFCENGGKRVEGADVVEIPRSDLTDNKLSRILHALLGKPSEDFVPYTFSVWDNATKTKVSFDEYLANNKVTSETELMVEHEKLEIFKVHAPTRLGHRIPGHEGPIVTAQFSPESYSRFATGAGDCMVRIWDTDTGTPHRKLAGHKADVLCVSWAPDASRLASGGKDKQIFMWDPVTGSQIGQPFRGHTKEVMSLAWEPYHLWRDGTPRIASGGRDQTTRIWVVNTGRVEHVLGGHVKSVTCVRWGGTGLLYTASQDKTIKVWNSTKGTLVRSLEGHSHWVNYIALSTDFVLRTSYFDRSSKAAATDDERRSKAKERFDKVAMVGTSDPDNKISRELLVSAGEDTTVCLWDPTSDKKKPIATMNGHGKPVNHVVFSPDGRLIASAGWDNHTKIWNARDGKFLATLLGHVGPVYQCVFSADSRLLVTCSKDTTVKIWDMQKFKLLKDLPGHEDQAWAVDWSPDGQRVGSGGRDKAVRLWRN